MLKKWVEEVLTLQLETSTLPLVKVIWLEMVKSLNQYVVHHL
jgi:hypothetical protein